MQQDSNKADFLAKRSFPLIALGTARVSNGLLGPGNPLLMVELVVDPEPLSIIDADSNVALPGYSALLKGALRGRTTDDRSVILREISSSLSGPLLKPTLAAVRRALDLYGDARGETGTEGGLSDAASG